MNVALHLGVAAVKPVFTLYFCFDLKYCRANVQSNRDISFLLDMAAIIIIASESRSHFRAVVSWHLFNKLASGGNDFFGLAELFWPQVSANPFPLCGLNWRSLVVL